MVKCSRVQAVLGETESNITLHIRRSTITSTSRHLHAAGRHVDGFPPQRATESDCTPETQGPTDRQPGAADGCIVDR